VIRESQDGSIVIRGEIFFRLILFTMRIFRMRAFGIGIEDNFNAVVVRGGFVLLFLGRTSGHLWS
jgi:hypothetical protein